MKVGKDFSGWLPLWLASTKARKMFILGIGSSLPRGLAVTWDSQISMVPAVHLIGARGLFLNVTQ
ncbi:hypothetical protein MD535_07350 [Vibrio sp. ZSDZ65]|uniref:Uncharacterized protein n=1 Tax=Vibrio qingdaonensis TaxID=2829491 RepID=A0A9X3CLY7_9VIBR|nr:hypothetical protein [Vibrio qingdaonensis]MCW8345823.1 hypothetical protein [Vibrio qingdaonensis]